MASKRERHVGGKVVLHVSAEELERELANMEQLLRVLKHNIMRAKPVSREQREKDCAELEETFDVAMTAMKQVWLWIEGGDSDTEIHVGSEPWQPK